MNERRNYRLGGRSYRMTSSPLRVMSGLLRRLFFDNGFHDANRRAKCGTFLVAVLGELYYYS